MTGEGGGDCCASTHGASDRRRGCMGVGLDIGGGEAAREGGQGECIQDAPTYLYHRPSHIKEHKVLVSVWTAVAITNLEQRGKVDVGDGYERHGKSRTATPIDSGLFLTKVPIFFPIGPYILHSSSSRSRIGRAAM